MLRWQGLDIHDLEAEEEAEAQRQEYKQRLKVETQEPLQLNGNNDAVEPAVEDLNIQYGLNGDRKRSSAHRRSLTATVETTPIPFAGALQPESPVVEAVTSTTSTDNLLALEGSSDDALSEPPSSLGDEPPGSFLTKNGAVSTNNSRSAVRLHHSVTTSFQQADVDLEATNIRGTLRSRKRIQSPLRQLFKGFRGQDDDTLHGHEPETEAFLDRIARPSPTVDFVAVWATALGFFCSLWALVTEVLSVAWHLIPFPYFAILFSLLKGTFTVARPLRWGFWHLGKVLLGIFTCLLVFGLSMEACTRIATSITAGVDSLSLGFCQLHGLGWTCSLSCSVFPTIGLFVFPRTCTRGSSGRLHIEIDSPWDINVETNVNAFSILGNKFDECRTNCSQYGSKIERVRQHWGVPEEEQDELYERLPRICDALREIPINLPWYKRFVAMFTESLLHHINKTEADIEKATYGAGANARTKQEIIQRTPPTMSLWRERYANIANDGTQFKQGIADTGKLVGNTKDKIQQVKAKTVEKKREILRRWPLARRLGRYVGLLRHDPEELSKVTESSKALDQWYQELCIVQRLLMIAERNVDQLNKPLHDLAHNAWDKDVTFHHGDGMTKIQALYGGMKSRAREISRTASRDEGTNDDEQE